MVSRKKTEDGEIDLLLRAYFDNLESDGRSRYSHVCAHKADTPGILTSVRRRLYNYAVYVLLLIVTGSGFSIPKSSNSLEQVLYRVHTIKETDIHIPVYLCKAGEFVRNALTKEKK